MLVRWWSGPPVLVIVTRPPEPAIQLSTDKARGTFQACIPRGPIEVRPLTKTEKHFLASRGMNTKLFKSSRVFAVSDEAVNRFDTDRKALADLANQIGLSRDDLYRVLKAKRRLATFQPKSFDERRAARELRALFSCTPPAKEKGRPGLKAADRMQMHMEADQLRQEGKTTEEIVRVLAQRYELRRSYTKRILEDASQSAPVITRSPREPN